LALALLLRLRRIARGPDAAEGCIHMVTRSTFDEGTKQLDRAIKDLETAFESFFFLDSEHSRAEVMAWFLQVQAAFAATRPAD